jgi:hypothetical protein
MLSRGQDVAIADLLQPMGVVSARACRSPLLSPARYRAGDAHHGVWVAHRVGAIGAEVEGIAVKLETKVDLSSAG